jgi:hypothetical protein
MVRHDVELRVGLLLGQPRLRALLRRSHRHALRQDATAVYGTYDYHTNSWSGDLRFEEHKLEEPLRVKSPQIVFANSMSDVCHPVLALSKKSELRFKLPGLEH